MVPLCVSDREFVDTTNDPNDPYDKGAPDYQSGEKKDTKWRIICSGVESLIDKEGLSAEQVVLWVDWSFIYQDDVDEKLKGVRSLIKYTTLCDFMLVPMDKALPTEYPYSATSSSIVPEYGEPVEYAEDLPGYGSRGWCRCEYFIFSLWAEIQEVQRDMQLYTICREGELVHFPKVKVSDADCMPSGGAFSVDRDWNRRRSTKRRPTTQRPQKPKARSQPP